MCILRDLPQQKNPRALCWVSFQILNDPMFPWKYFFSTKQKRSEEIKRELFTQEEILVLMHSPEVRETPSGSRPRVPLTQENALIHKPALLP
jgi:hypothetical protein